MRLLLIADGGPEIGAGHWVRMLALAEYAMDRRWQPTLVTRQVEPRPPAAWDAAPCPVRVVPDYTTLPPADYAIVDTYPNAGVLAGTDLPMTAYDDMGGLVAPGLRAVVNPNPGAERFGYPGIPLAYAGPRYAAIRRAFQRVRKHRSGPVRYVLIGLGGTGNLSVWPRLVNALKPYRDATALLYGTRPHPVSWYTDQLRMEVRAVTDTGTAWAAFTVADLAFAGLGVTALECLCVGIPTVAYAVSLSQQANVPGWRACGFPTLRRDIAHRLDTATRAALSQRGLDMVDGRDRVLSLLA